jgi:hypothetical protein
VALSLWPTPRTRIRNFELVFRARRDGQNDGATYREAHLAMEILAVELPCSAFGKKIL